MGQDLVGCLVLLPTICGTEQNTNMMMAIARMSRAREERSGAGPIEPSMLIKRALTLV